MNLLADFCNRIGVAARSRLKLTIVRNSFLVRICLFKMIDLGFIYSCQILDYKYIKVFLKYTIFGYCVIRGIGIIKTVSFKSGLKKKNIQKSMSINNLKLNGFVFFCTSLNHAKVLTDVECIINNTGGVAIMEVY